MFTGTLGASLLWNLLIGKRTIRAGKGATATSQGQGTIRAGQDFKCSLIFYQILKYKSVIKMNLNLILCLLKK